MVKVGCHVTTAVRLKMIDARDDDVINPFMTS